MKILCDICGGELEIAAGGNSATCKNCGMPHSLARVREKLGMTSAPAHAPKVSKKVESVVIEEEEIIDINIDDIEIVEDED